MASPQTHRIRVFIDSSVLYAAALSATGPARELILRGIRGECDLVISPLVLEETERNLEDKAPHALGPFGAFRDMLGARQVNPSKASIKRVAVTVNLRDAPIVAAALRGRVDYLATHDVKTLLRYKDGVKRDLGVTLVQPQEVLALLRGEQA